MTRFCTHDHGTILPDGRVSQSRSRFAQRPNAMGCHRWLSRTNAWILYGGKSLSILLRAARGDGSGPNEEVSHIGDCTKVVVTACYNLGDVMVGHGGKDLNVRRK